MHVGSLPFPTKFYFADGHACGNFNQLAIACDNRWEEARSHLAQGIWPPFFGSIGRLDLASTARQAAGDPDADRGLSLLLEKLPADADSLRPPKLALESTEENLGELMPGADLAFEMVILNQGMLLLRGTATSSSDWLVFGDPNGPVQKMFQTRNVCAISVRALGSKLRSGLKALHGEILIESNGGSMVLRVRAEVPIRPFPKGKHANDVLAGATTPREIALKAKQYPNEAALLFEQGAVKAWYAANGWTYPIEGSEGSGKGAVQQFFEALGLTSPPSLAIDTTALAFKGRIGERLTKRVTISTEEAKPVYAQAWSNQSWLTFGPIKYLGNKVKIAIEITIPPHPGETVHAQVTIQGNGKQQFLVPVSVMVGTESAPVVKRPVPIAVTEAIPAAEQDNSAELSWVDRLARWWKNNG